MSPSPSPEPRPIDPEFGLHGCTFSEVFSATRVGQPTVVSGILPDRFSLQVAGRNGIAPSSFTVLLEGSNDLVNWSTLVTHNATDGSVKYMSDAIPKPVRYLRLRCSAISLGSAPDILAVAVAAA